MTKPPAETATREDIERELMARGWVRRRARAGGPSVFERPKAIEDTGYCFVTDDYVCVIEYPCPGATGWVRIEDGLGFLDEIRP